MTDLCPVQYNNSTELCLVQYSMYDRVMSGAVQYL
jgi:hypothetical protein